MSGSKQQQQIPNRREKFIDAANRGKILANKCINCNHSILETVYFCERCFSDKFSAEEYEGLGNVVTFTIQSVAPEGFTDAGSYAWVVFRVDEAPFKVSGFLEGIGTPADLPIGSKVRVTGYDEKHGLILKRA